MMPGPAGLAGTDWAGDLGMPPLDAPTGLEFFVWALVVLLFASGLVKLAYLPLALAFEALAWRRRDEPGLLESAPLVSIVVPAYNEGKVIDASVRSILANPYEHIEVVLVDDGSTDDTPQRMAAWAEVDPRVRWLRKANGGKGAAINAGLEWCTGEVVMLVDADGVFTDDTITQALRAFRTPRVGAVCGDDRPVNLDRVQTRFLAFISHVGTGLVRRALHMLGCVPVVSGNNGAFRRSALADVGPLRTDTVGEDLELTWRLHRAGYDVAFAPRAVVYAESPSTLGGLWRQRVRWARGLLQSLGLHRDAILNPRHPVFGIFLAYTVVAMVIVPLVQLGFLGVVAIAGLAGQWAGPTTLWGVLAWLSLLVGLVLAVASALLDRSARDLRHGWTLPLWPLYSMLMSMTMVRALWLSLRHSPARWNKLERTGVISVAGVSGAAVATDLDAAASTAPTTTVVAAGSGVVLGVPATAAAASTLAVERPVPGRHRR